MIVVIITVLTEKVNKNVNCVKKVYLVKQKPANMFSKKSTHR